MRQTKQFDSQVKSIDTAKGLVTSVVAVFNNVDAVNDRIMPGAFAKSIAAWKHKMTTSRASLPVVFGHKDAADAILGKVLDMRETAEGLEIEAQYYLNKPMARDALQAMEDGVLGGSSFAYDVKKARRTSDGIQELLELDVLEVGPTLYPANDSTRLVGIKTPPAPNFVAGQTYLADMDGQLHPVETTGAGTSVSIIESKAGRTISARTEKRIRDAISAHEAGITALHELLAEYGVAQEGKTEEPEGAKVDDPPIKAAARKALEAALAAQASEGTEP